MSIRCAWCNQDKGELRRVMLPLRDPTAWVDREESFAVHPECEADFRNISIRVNRYGRLFLAILAAALFVVTPVSIIFHVTGSTFHGIVGLGGSVLMVGTALLLFPFATPETVRAVGVRNAVFLVRALAIAILGFGSYILFCIP